MLYEHDCKFQPGETVRVNSPSNVGIPIDSRIGTVESVKVTSRDYNLVTFRYNDGDEVMLEDFEKDYEIGDRYNGIAMTLVGQPTVTKIETRTRYYRHVMVRNNRTGEISQECEPQLMKWYL